MARSHFHFARGCVIVSVFVYACFLVSSASAQAPFTVEWKDGRLSVVAERTPLAQVLREVARWTGLEIRGLEGIQQEVSVRFSGLLLREGLRKLLIDVNFVLVEDPPLQGATRPVLALVVGRRTASAPEGSVSPKGQSVAEVAILGEVWAKPEAPVPEVVILGPDGNEVKQ